MRIIFAGTPDFALAPLRKIIAEHEVVAVFTQPDRAAGRGKKLTSPPVKQLAAEHNIAVYQPDTLKNQVERIKGFSADVMVVVAYGMLLPQQILDAPRFGCINIHASLLPRWRGAAPIQRAIEAGDLQTGVSVMKMELGLDTGPIFQTLVTPICEYDTSADLHDRLSELGALGISTTLTQLAESGMPELTAQDDSEACYAKKILKAEARIDWNLSAKQIQQRIRAFNPWPICTSIRLDERIRIWQASHIAQNTGLPAGQVVNTDAEGIYVACGSGLLRLEALQRDGSRPLPWREFRNGYSVRAGERFI